MMAVFEKELRAYFHGVTGFVFSAFLLLFVGIYMMVGCLYGLSPHFEYVLGSTTFIFLIGIPLLTMRSVAEEKRLKTDQLLYALPLSMTRVVLGKYLALLVVLALPMLVMGLYPLLLTSFGEVNLRAAYASLFGFFMLGACLSAIGLFISSITENQVTAAVLCLVTMLVLYFMSGLASYISSTAAASVTAFAVLIVVLSVILWLLTRNTVVSVGVMAVCMAGLFFWYGMDSAAFAGLFPAMMTHLSVFDRFFTIVDGVFDLTAIVYYASIAGVFLFLSVQAMEKRSWSA